MNSIDSLILLARLLLAGVFGLAAIAKLADSKGTRDSLAQFGVPQALGPAGAWALPLGELACAVALVNADTASAGAALALALLLLFVAAIGVNMRLGRHPDCHCFGQLHSEPAGWPAIRRNVVLGAAAGLVFWHGPPHVEIGAVIAELAAGQGATAALWAVVVLQGVVGIVLLYQLMRQNGRMLERLDALEARAGGSTQAPPPAGLPIDSEAPAFALPDLDGGTASLDAILAGGRPALLFFSEPGCSVCDALLPEVGHWQREHAAQLTVVPISRGGVAANRSKAQAISGMLLQLDREVAQRYRVEHSPSAVLVRDGRIASPLAVGTEEIRALVAQATAPPPLKPGDPLPALELRDLKGGSQDLANLRGQRTMLLFWNPDCGFCEAMLDEVKAWEAQRPPDAPQLIVIASGSPARNREQGFQSRVLLDARFSAGTRFGAGGTPAAVLIGEDGLTASAIGTGAVEVMALARGLDA